MGGGILDLLASYLTDRRFCVKVGCVFSDMYEVDVGVPHGSVLGPLLFLLFVNEITEYVTGGCVTMFADDTTTL
ncbi:MAG: hypothetical protein KTM48_01600 [Wolbachia endosymbiont of Pissodes strobi]|nr:hypothetical protein [Wolbachia endosymbiont of Pissodes strobi]